MEYKQILETIKNNKSAGLVIVAVFVLSASIITFAQPLRYEAKGKLIAIPVLESKDPYAISKANETIANVLSKAAPTGLFFNQLLETEPGINRSYFGNDAKMQAETWEKAIAAVPVNDTGIIDVSVFHTDKEQARMIAQAVSTVMKTKNNLFHGRNFPVEIRVLNAPQISDWPARPNITANYAAALAVSLILYAVYLYLFATMPDIGGAEKIAEQKEAVINFRVIGNNLAFDSTGKAPRPYGQPPYSDNREQKLGKAEQAKISAFQSGGERTVADQPSAGYANDDLDLDDILKNGSMANIFGQSKK